MNLAQLTSMGSLVLGLAGCTVGPVAERPPLASPAPTTFMNSAEPLAAPTPVMSRWWQQIDDPLFDRHVEALLTENLTLQEAGERVRQAHERLAIQAGGNLPALTADAGARRGFTPNGTPDRTYAGAYSTDLNVSWTLDLFGRRHRTLESGEAFFFSAQAEHEALQHALIAELLNRRVAIAVDARLLELAVGNVHNRSTLFQLVKHRYDLGTRGTELTDVYLAEENYTTVQADVPQFERLLADDLYRFDVLLGRPPGTTQLQSAAFPLLAPPPTPPAVVPATLLDRRPDLRASELRARAATANVGVAIADLYPQLTLGGRLGFASTSPGNLLSTDQLVGSILGNVSHRLFAGGALSANLRLQESAARELAHRYASDVLNAFREVESALKADQELALQLAAQDRSLQALKAAEALAETRYRSGIESLRGLLDTQQRRYRAEQAWLRTQQLRWTTRISLHLALGGDWIDFPASLLTAGASAPTSL